jgi:hypothetical protein
MLAIQQSRASFVSKLEFSAKEVTDLTGVRRPTLRTWHNKSWGGTSGSWPNVHYSVLNLLVVAALNHWSINGLKVTDEIAGRLYYAVRAARVPFVVICITGHTPSVVTAEPDNLLAALTGLPATFIYDPKDLLVEIYSETDGTQRAFRLDRRRLIQPRIREDPVTDQLF